MLLEALSGSDCTTLLVLGVATIIIIYVISASMGGASRGPRAPPSLPVLPIVGSLPFLPFRAEKYHTAFLQKSKKLGKVFSFQVGSQYTVVLNGREAIHEALVKRAADFADRAPMFAERKVWNVGLRGVISKKYNENFKKYHHLSLIILKEFGFGNPQVLESRIVSELEIFLKLLRDTNGKPLYPKELLSFSLLNVISGILLAHRFDGIDATIRGVITQVAQFLNQLDPVLDIIPLSRYLPKYQRLIKEMHEVKAQLMGTIKVLGGVGLGKTEDNFVKSFVEKEGEHCNVEELEYTVRDLANGGMQTTAIMLLWAVVLLGNDQRVQEQMRKEIAAAVPEDRLPSLDDKRHLPYVEATMLEIFRCRGLLPFVFPHATSCETEVAGFQIPEKTTVLINMHSVHMDPEVWQQPEKFLPERFLSNDGTVINKENVIPFSLGKRSCPGEELARQEMFLFLTAIVQKFNILPPEGQSKIRDEPVVVRFLYPAPFEARFVPRH